MPKQSTEKITALYCRLSRDDENEGESAVVPVDKRYVAKTTSFTVLGDYLIKQGKSVLKLPFDEVERVIGKKLCASALKYHSYWYPAKDRPMANVIYNTGYDVKSVDLKGRVITLVNPTLEVV